MYFLQKNYLIELTFFMHSRSRNQAFVNLELHSPPLHPTTILGFVGILAKFVGKFSWPNVVGKFGVYYHKKQNAEFYQHPLPEKSNFYRQWRLLKKLYKIFTDDYDNNEYSAVKYTRYLAVKYPRFFTINIIWCL